MAGALLTGTGNVTVASAPSGSSITGVRPSNAVAGERLVAFHYSRGTSAPVAAPAGWTALPTAQDGTVGSIGLYTATSPTAYDFVGGSGRQCLVIARTVDLDGAKLLGAAGAYATLVADGASGTQLTAPSVDLADTYDLLIAVAANNTTGNAPVGFTAAGMSIVGQAGTATGSSDSTFTVLQELVPAAGASGSRVVKSGPASSGAGFLVALRTTNKPTGAAPTPLSANAGADQRNVTDGTPVTITGTPGGGTTPYTTSWSQTVGTPVTLSAVSGFPEARRFTAPVNEQPQRLAFRYTVRDAAGTEVSDVMIVDVAGTAAGQAPGSALTPLNLPSRSKPRDLAQANADLDKVLAWLTSNGL